MDSRVFPGFDFPLSRRSALLVIDMQPCGVDADAGLIRAIEATAPGYTRYLVERVRSTVVPSLQRLCAAFRRHGRPVYFTAFASAAGDGRDVLTSTIRDRDAARRARTGASVILPRTHPATDVVATLGPAPGDHVLTKTSMDAFVSTTLADELHVAGIQSLVVTGVLTDACVESSARHAAERGFQVTVVEDACAAWEEDFHAKSLGNLARYFARIASTAEVLAELSAPGGNRPGPCGRGGERRGHTCRLALPWRGAPVGRRAGPGRALAAGRGRMAWSGRAMTTSGVRARRAGARARRRAGLARLGRVLLFLATLAGPPAAAQAPRCAEDVVADVGLDGRVLALRSGARFQVVPADAPVASLWLPGLGVVVCERELNVDGTRLTSYEIRARDEPDRVRAFALPAR